MSLLEGDELYHLVSADREGYEILFVPFGCSLWVSIGVEKKVKMIVRGGGKRKTNLPL